MVIRLCGIDPAMSMAKMSFGISYTAFALWNLSWQRLSVMKVLQRTEWKMCVNSKLLIFCSSEIPHKPRLYWVAANYLALYTNFASMFYFYVASR